MVYFASRIKMSYHQVVHVVFTFYKPKFNRQERSRLKFGKRGYSRIARLEDYFSLAKHLCTHFPIEIVSVMKV